MNVSRRKEYWQLTLMAFVAVVFIVGGSLSEPAQDVRHTFVEIYSKLGFAVLVAAAIRLVGMMMRARADDNVDKYREMEEVGIVRVRKTLGSDELKRFFSHANHIRVRKTWFPENETLQDGLIGACERGAEIDLVLADPDCELLRLRSVGAHRSPGHGGATIRDALGRICRAVIASNALGRHKMRLRTYAGWPGVPVIQCDKLMLVGSYPLGCTSPDWPWLEVDPESEMGAKLTAHHDAADYGSSPAPGARTPFLRELLGADQILAWSCEVPSARGAGA
jgi:hypothetical protein